ncbi:MAG TPA: CPBP family intramembrane glutamic endopeptidase [Bryobacteraceae bacterium]
MRLAPFFVVVVSLALVFAFAARTYSERYALTFPTSLIIYSSFVALLALALLPAFNCKVQFFRYRRSRLLFIFVFCLPYLLYAAGSGDFRALSLLKLAVIPTLMLLIYWPVPVKNLEAFCWQDAAAGCSLIAIVLSGFLKGIWNVPVNLDFMNRLFLIAVAAWTWTELRPVPDLGYTLSPSRKILLRSAQNFLFFAVIAIPLSLALHFTRWHPRWPGLFPFCLNYLEIFLFIALLEELFFRGFLQSLLSKTWRRWWSAQLAVSCLFGLFHILHAPFPNWRYVALATLAGWFYGSAFRQTGNLTAAVLLHAAVDTTWRTWLSAR